MNIIINMNTNLEKSYNFIFSGKRNVSCGKMEFEADTSRISDYSIPERTFTLLGSCGGHCGTVLYIENDDNIVITDIYIYSVKYVGKLITF